MFAIHLPTFQLPQSHMIHFGSQNPASTGFELFNSALTDAFETTALVEMRRIVYLHLTCIKSTSHLVCSFVRLFGL